MLCNFRIGSSWAKTFNAIAIVFAIIGIFELVTWFDYRKPVEVHNRIFKNLRVQAGGLFVYENHFTRYRYCNTVVERWFVGSDDVVRPIDPLPSSMPTEGLNQIQTSVASISVPPAMPPGRSKSCFRSHWQCTPLQVLWPINGDETCLEFTVVPAGALSLWLPDPNLVFAIGSEP